MELKFLGIGGAFNPLKGNTSAYFKENNELFLIDCGENIFTRIIEKNILEDIKSINIMVTHLHSDHIGSISTLIDYAYYILKIPVYIITSNIIEYDIASLLNYTGITKEKYSFKDVTEYTNYKSFNSIKYIKTSHVIKLASYSLIFETNRGIIYYSGDTKELNTLKSLLNNNLYKAYIDTNSSNNPANTHVYIGDLIETVDNKYKDKIYCMHINDNKCMEMIKESGFNIVETN